MMFKMLKYSLLRKGIITTRYPKEPITSCERTKGLPVIDMTKCTRCGACSNVCPVAAITVDDSHVTIDAGTCIFCGACERACNYNALKLGHDVELATKQKESLRAYSSARRAPRRQRGGRRSKAD